MNQNVIGLILAVVLAVCTALLSPEFATNFGVDAENLGTVKVIAYLLSVAIGAYNGYQLSKKP